MKRALVFLVMLTGVTHAFLPAAETYCNATQNTSTCSVYLGDSVYIQVMVNASGHRLLCKKQLPSGPINLFTLKKEKVMIEEAFRDRTEFFINNGTFKISKVEKTDSGQYTVEIFTSQGLRLETKIVNLDVQENILPIVILASAVVGLLVIVTVVTCCICRKKKRHRKQPVAEL